MRSTRSTIDGTQAVRPAGDREESPSVAARLGSDQHLVEHLFRRRAGQITATLTRIFGVENLDLVEEVVQESFVRALRTWPLRGVPDNPSAWLIQAAKNRALDSLRRRQRWSAKAAEVHDALLPASGGDDQPGAYFSAEIDDDQLAMMFACCHPSLTRDAQVALTLKAVGGFSVGEIAAAFLAKPATIAQRLVRAKRVLRNERAEFRLPGPDELTPRRDAVLEVLYLMFKEGYAATDSDELVREDLCHEAIRLVELFSRNAAVTGAEVNALAALFCFQASRLETRTGDDGGLLLLEEQNRSRWSRPLIRRGLAHLQEATGGDRLTSYHLQAEIAARHAVAPTWEATDWAKILDCYDALLELDPSPVVALNRVVAIAQVHGPEAALETIEELANDGRLRDYYLFHAVHGELLRRTGDREGAQRALARAIELTASPTVRGFLRQRLH